MHLNIEHLSKTYANGVHALQGVSLSIPRGMFGLLGPNGAGKSTLMRILATLQEADSGSATLGNLDVLRQKEALRRVLGYLPQEFGLYPKVSAEDLLDHFALLKGIGSGAERRRTVAALLQQTNLWAARHKKLGGFSGGMRQRFGIAVALIGDPRLIIVDEPTAGLDPAERVRFLNLLSEIGENAVVILSTHIVEDVSELCSRMAIINHGRILLEGEPLDTIERLRGRVWRRITTRDQLPALEAAHTVISTKLLSGRTVVHVVADARPDASFDPVEPDLEDVYFSTIRGVPLDRLRGAFDVGPAAAAPVVLPSAASATAVSRDKDRTDSDDPVDTQPSVDPVDPVEPTAESIPADPGSPPSADVETAGESPNAPGSVAPFAAQVGAESFDARDPLASTPIDDTVDVTAAEAAPAAASTSRLDEGVDSADAAEAGASRSTAVTADGTGAAPAPAAVGEPPRFHASPSIDNESAEDDTAPLFDHDTLPLFPEYGDMPGARGAAGDSLVGDGDSDLPAAEAFPDQLGLFGGPGAAVDAR
ncbi:MAG: ABC-type multidrug transport system, ATPase component [Gemmatimonadetes bacterium]|nr:ABC-type multidrug transport system, ATPase component [Gemmatimonadota bacterium]